MSLSKRVVGGKAAKDGDFPFAVFVSSPYSTNNTACAGAILTDQVIVTAAYCVYNTDTGQAVDPSRVNVGFGKSNKAEQPVTSVKKIIINSNYGPNSGINDIALLQVNLTQLVSSTVNRIPVYIGDVKSGDSLSFMGWGSSQKIGVATSDVLNYANVTVGDDSSCSGVDLYQNSNGRAICTRNKLTPGTAPCLGDYGGPLVTYDQGVPKLVGVFSTFGTPDGRPLDYCGNNNTLAYYTHISYYLSFIQQKTGLSANDLTGNYPLEPVHNSTQGASPGSAKARSGLSNGAIAGISIAAVALVILLCILYVLIRRSKRKIREIRHEQQIYELGLQQLADELGGSYEPKLSSTVSAFNSSFVTPLNTDGVLGFVSSGYRHVRHSAYSDMAESNFAEYIPQMTDVGTEIVLDTLSKTLQYTDGSPRVMDYIRPSRDAKVSDYYRHLLFYDNDDDDGDSPQEKDKKGSSVNDV
ncbi:Transmembrane protease serine 5 [Coemansia erecta]|uniref:Transmembrane protease serine 5 n=1 Tax=Coemansia asiatica TaxID=1052880 RepID=A0A9W7XI16_9FUNG|nr:Transmembrane protease serine 5 [Coemansia asiatica]KAJ2853378.1 Transmembrane protease serine 5 [Coemansia erecta]